MATDRKDPFLANRFTVALEIDGVTQASFSECSGLTAEVEFEERREGGVNAFAHKLPRGTKYSNLVLKRGITDSDDLWRWHQGTIDGDIKEKSLSIALLDSSGNEQWRWNLERAVPVKWAGPDFKSEGSAVAIETLELAHHGLRKG
jgi:phage tail-like protein